ncbi:MAG: sigma-70 family RNA polymerase sigma factor [Bacteroidales bacterium]
MKEFQLIQKCREKDREAQRELYELYARKMLTVCLRYSEDLETARDLLQEGFIKVFVSLDTFNFSGSLEGWIRRIMVNTSLEYLRKHDMLREAIDLSATEMVPSEMPSVLDEISANELMAIIKELPQGFRAVFNLYAIEGYSHKEIADMLEITESTSRSQYTRAKRFLQKRLVEMDSCSYAKSVV